MSSLLRTLPKKLSLVNSFCGNWLDFSEKYITMSSVMPLDSNFLLINKPAGWTSFDVVNLVRKRMRAFGTTDFPELRIPNNSIRNSDISAFPKIKRIKVGHAGTLDPFATGLLIVAVGRDATKRLDEFKNLPKTYVAKLHLGATSDSGDVTGMITAVISNPDSNRDEKSSLHTSDARSLLAEASRDDIKKILQQFLGKQLQTPPMHSAKSVNGVRLYKLARQGKTIERQPNEIEIYRLSLIAYTWPYLTIEVECSAGTYIRTLAEDIGAKLGVGAYCEELTRTKIGEYTLETAQSIESFK